MALFQMSWKVNAGGAISMLVIVGAVIALLVISGIVYFIFLHEGGDRSEDGNGDGNANRKPLANAGTTQVVLPGEPAILNASGSMDPDGDVLKYYWDVDSGTDSNNDGQMDNDRDKEGMIVEHHYPVPDETTSYLVTLNVTDGKDWDKATTRVTVLVQDNSTPPEVTLTCRYGRIPGENPLEPHFILTVSYVTTEEMISNFSYRLDGADGSTISEGYVGDLVRPPPGSDLMFVDIVPFTRMSVNDFFDLKEGGLIGEGCLFSLFYLAGVEPVGEVEITKG